LRYSATSVNHPQFAVDYYRRNLPHWLPQGPPIFLTWRLYGSLPASYFTRLREIKKFSAGEEFRRADELLDRADKGPLWLKDSRVAECVVEKLARGDSSLNHYALHAYVVMSNHVHVLLTPHIEVRRLTNSLKGVIARAANNILQHTAQHFWQDESYDHWCRSLAEFARIREYIERNPVAAGLVSHAKDWPWSSAHRNGK
jgi:REP-associated tyrosine transposase